VLPTAERIAEFYADALATIPGVSAGRVCLGPTGAEAGDLDQEVCAGCRGRGSPLERQAVLPSARDCPLSALPDVRVIPLRTAATGYGFFVVRVGDPEVFGRYEPFVANIGGFLALWLENREQHNDLRRARDVLEHRVDERTVQLRAANAKLEAEVEERKRAENMVRRLNEELEQRVRDRTAQLEAANRELEAFAYSVSHDLRAPLRHISGFADILQEVTAGLLDQEGSRYLDAICDSAAQMGDLIDDLLAFSRAGRTQLSTRPVDLSGLVREVVKDFDPETGGRVVRWTIEELPVVLGDRAMLRVVLVNLISNALKFTRTRPVAEITIGSVPGPGPEIVLFVRDNGIGFDPSNEERLFGVFERLPEAASFEGTGIGLANVRRIVQRHSGRTWAEGMPGEGATFLFSLPRSAAADPRSARQAPAPK
jgi:signal transduction histidine kinase